MQIHDISFTIHYGEIKTVRRITANFEHSLFTIHYGEIKTGAKCVLNDALKHLQSTMVRLRQAALRNPLHGRNRY